ncbi:hypothetical protein [Microbacterium oleivorans]|uniref:Uncharacterized protein n=1 Tax=Microbacterium oleivorans TaxID=273677 RepID=A0A7D5JY86_9MICO|nr:hypothetical protein [Microbacterium oleivorans]QLD11643.1 hypothetical protein HW566_07580 [Microbacterium oleivorans]
MKTTRTGTASALLLLATLALAGCATSPGQGAGVPETAAPGGDASAPAGDAELYAAWLDAGRAIGVVTFGSSSCAPVVGEATAAGQTVTVEITDPEGVACTRDYVPRASYVMLPAGVDPAQDVEVFVTGTYAGDTDLDGVAGLTAPDTEGEMAEMTPSAGWFDDDGIVLLTYGSSTCPPVFESVDAVSAEEIRAVEAAAPADQVCTADYAPQLSVLQIPGVSGDARPGEIVLVSATGDEQRVGILG